MLITNMGAAAEGRRPHVCNMHFIFLKCSQTFSNVLNISQIFSNLLKLSQMFSIFLNLSQYFSNILKDSQTFSNVLKYAQHLIFSYICVAPDLARKMRRKKLAPEARKQRRALEKLKMMPKASKTLFTVRCPKVWRSCI